MSIAPVESFAYSVDALKDGLMVSIPLALSNPDYGALLDLAETPVDFRNGIYNAFPDLRLIGGSLVAIYSSGPAHGVSDRQIMTRSDDWGETWASVDFQTDDNPGVYDTSLLDGLLATGEKAVFKVWTVEKTSDGYQVTVQSTVVESGVTYALWGQPIDIGGVLYRGGYGNNAGQTEAALFKSEDGGTTWAFVAVICADAGRHFSESAIVECADGSLLAVIREDGLSATRPLVWVRTTGAPYTTWSAPVQFDPAQINGVQPWMVRLADDSLLLMAGDRVGASGMSEIGVLSTAQNITGCSMWRCIDGLGNAWSSRYPMTAMWSTDGGQPVGVQMPDGKIAALAYKATRSTALSDGNEPGISYFTFNPTQMV